MFGIRRILKARRFPLWMALAAFALVERAPLLLFGQLVVLPPVVVP